MKFEAKVVGRINIPNDRRIVFDHVHVRGEDYSHRNLMQLGTIGCRLEGCRFNGVQVEGGVQLGAGRELSEFIECSFDGARMDSGGGFSRFVRCSFRNADLRGWICLRTEFVDCIFSGRIRKCIFNGTVPEQDRAWVARGLNEFHGNDFSAADLIEVDFRTGIDLTQQRLPGGAEYLYLPDPMPVIERVRTEVLGWLDFEHRRIALIMLKTMEEQVAGGQRQLLLRASDHYAYASLPREAVDNIFALLRGRLPH